MNTSELLLDRGVCGIKINKENKSYVLKSFESEKTLPDGWNVTHFGPCGKCSSLQDLTAYINVQDMMSETRSCGRYLLKRRRINCLKRMGLSTECAEAWDNNIKSTRTHCLAPCMWSWSTSEPNLQKGTSKLNNCLQCDEDVSGPRFKKEAGRTRRNSGIISNILRTNGENYQVDHSKYMKITNQMLLNINT